MRQNLPVTQKEYVIADDATLMSVTDTESHIQYCNASFIEVSGYTREELLAQPHNIVRHPDMPRDVFEDMWKTLSGGETWTGLVKNRRKNGDHYWVRANVTPVKRHGQVVGYASVRTKPERDEVTQTEALYQRCLRNQIRGWRVHKGIVTRRGLLRWVSLFQVAPIGWRLALGLGAHAGGSLLAAWSLGMSTNALVDLALGLAAVTLAVGYYYNRQITQPLKTILGYANQVAAGQKPDAEALNRIDEIGMIQRAINQAGLNLRSLIDDVGDQVDGIAFSSRELSQGSDALSERTEQTSSSLQRTAAAVLQTSQSLEQNAGSAREVASLTSDASTMARNGCEVVTEVITTMSSIRNASEKISSIIGLIDDIAFQTNILALNAAVEAARAGEQGRSFAVVAAEVRTLAERSTEAAKDIKSLIMDSAEQVAQGTVLANTAGESMQEISNRFDKVSELIAGISSAVIEQNLAVSQISDAINEVDDMTSRNSGLVAESSQASSDLLVRADRLIEATAAYGSVTTEEAANEPVGNFSELDRNNTQAR